jgi:hypothetical protein
VIKSSIEKWKAERFICIGPNSWGRGDSIKRAQRNCCQFVELTYCVVYEARCEGVLISILDGTLNWPEGESPPVIVWMGSEFSRMNPGRSVGQLDGVGHA